jgi:hypothetical protein
MTREEAQDRIKIAQETVETMKMLIVKRPDMAKRALEVIEMAEELDKEARGTLKNLDLLDKIDKLLGEEEAPIVSQVPLYHFDEKAHGIRLHPSDKGFFGEILELAGDLIHRHEYPEYIIVPRYKPSTADYSVSHEPSGTVIALPVRLMDLDDTWEDEPLSVDTVLSLLVDAILECRTHLDPKTRQVARYTLRDEVGLGAS